MTVILLLLSTQASSTTSGLSDTPPPVNSSDSKLTVWPITMAHIQARLITPAMRVLALKQVPHLPLAPGLHWLVVLCLVGSPSPSATLTSWHQGYLQFAPYPNFVSLCCACHVPTCNMLCLGCTCACCNDEAIKLRFCGVPAWPPSITLDVPRYTR